MSIHKTEQIIAGLRTMCALQPFGYRYTMDEITGACGCTNQSISLIEKSALGKLRVALTELAEENDYVMPDTSKKFRVGRKNR